MNYLQYTNLTKKEIEKIKALNPKEFAGKCYCEIHDSKPTWCKQGPILSTLMPSCGFYFVKDDYDKLVRKGECTQCGRCCALLRVNGSPYGFYHPEGKPCVRLKIEEEKNVVND